MKFVVVILTAVMTFFSLVTPAYANAAEEVENNCPRKVKVLVEEIEGQLFNEYRRFKAEFQAETLQAVAKMAGTVTDLKVSDGDLVSEGFELVVINDGLAKEIKEAEQQVKIWKKTLWNREHWKVRSPSAEKQAKAKMTVAREKLSQLQIEAKKALVVAPVQGKVKLAVAPGSEVAVGDVIAEIVNTNKMVSLMTVAADDLDLFAPGQKINLNADEGRSVGAEVECIKAGQVKLFFDNSGMAYPSFTGEFKLLKQQVKDAVVIGQNQVLKDESVAFVYKVNGKYALKSVITTGAVEDGKVMVLSGLDAGDLLVVAQLVSAKTGETDISLRCLEDGKKIKPMAKDSETGKFRALKKIKPGKQVKTEKVVQPEPKPVTRPEKMPVEKKVKKEKVEKEEIPGTHYIALGAGIGYTMMADDVFKDVYSSGGVSVNFHLSYNVTPAIEVFLGMSYFKQSGLIVPIEVETDYTSVPIYLGGRYLFKTSSKFTPYAGLAVTFFNGKEENVYNPDPSFDTARGVSLLAGTYYSLSRNVNMFTDIRYDIGKSSLDNMDEDIDRGGLRLSLGVVYRISL